MKTPVIADNPKWANTEQSAVDLSVVWEYGGEALAFTASANDPEPHGRALFQRAVQGEFGLVAAYDGPIFEPPSETLPPATVEVAKRRKLAEIADWRYKREVAGVFMNGARIKTDRESQAIITGAFLSLSQGLIQSVDWKAGNGQWVQLGLPEMTAIAQVVSAHVQGCFSLEKQFAELVAAADTIESVQAIVPPGITDMSAM
jgi:hypothetical protein